MRKIATIAASILFAFAAIAAGTSESSKATVYEPCAAEYDGPMMSLQEYKELHK